MKKYYIEGEIIVKEIRYFEIEANSEEEAIKKVLSNRYSYYDCEAVEDKSDLNIIRIECDE